MSDEAPSGGPPQTLAVHDLTLQLDEAVETLVAIRSGEVDAIVVAEPGAPRVYVLKGADHAHRVLLETLNEGALTIAPDTTILYANRCFAEMVGRAPERVLGRPLREFVAPGHLAAFDALLSEAPANAGGTPAPPGGGGRREIMLQRDGSDPLPVMASLRAIEVEGRACWTLVLTDLTLLKTAADGLRRAHDALESRVEARTRELSEANDALRAEVARRTELEAQLVRHTQVLIEADRRKDQFLSVLAHELRTPLAPIVTAVEMMRATAPDGAPFLRYLGVIERQGRNLGHLLDDLVDVSRLTHGSITLRRQVVELDAVLRSALESARPQIDAGRHALRMATPVAPVRLFADATRLEQIVVNLLGNAARYTDKGGLIQLTARQEGDSVVVSVADNGMGISADLLPRVFDLFVQGERSLDRSGGGLGIGLTLVKSLVRLHGGSVEARSEGPGRGSTFVVRLPVADRAPEPLDAPPPTSSGAKKKSRVLVVEDHADAALVLVDLLSRWGHDVRSAGDGAGALQVSKAFRPEIAIVDIGLPGMDGYAVARALRSELGPDPGVVLIALTGYGQEQDRLRSREAGFDHHVVKPADAAHIGRLVNGEDSPGS
jgi:PAS domain S-box-containing protein